MKPASRRLTRQHFALYRGWLEGAAIEGLHSAYGEAGSDVRLTRRLITTMRDALAVAARRARDVEAAHLLRPKPGSIPLAELHGRDDVPTLEDYRAQVDPDGVYGEAELIELYRGDFPPPPSPALDRKIARNARLRARQAAALERMERALVQDPAPEHPLDGWFEPAVAARLASAGLTTLADLLALIQRRRQRWYTAVPRLGPKGAQRITDWLDLHARSLHCILSPLATTPRRQLAVGHPVLTRPAVSADVAPLESLRVPPELDGSQGLNRAPVPAHQAELATDLDAVNAWIAIRGERSAHTARAYRREAERLLLWAIIVRRKPLSSLNTLDCREYINGFLADPQPAGRWIGNGKAERFDPAWRPFGKKLPPASRETARKILSAMCSWLVEEHYLLVNPFQWAAEGGPYEAAGRRDRAHAHARPMAFCAADRQPAAEPARRLGRRPAGLFRAVAGVCDGPAPYRAGHRHHRRAVAQGAGRRARRRLDAAGDGQGQAGAAGAHAAPADGDASDVAAVAADALHARDRARRHTADRPPEKPAGRCRRMRSRGSTRPSSRGPPPCYGPRTRAQRRI